MHPEAGWLEAAWDAPPGVCAGVTTRGGGASAPPFDTFNLAAHVGDDPAAVQQNRQHLRARLALPGEPCWLDQRHGNAVVELPAAPGAEADAAYTRRPGLVCAVLTADCIPLLLAARDGSEVAAVHAGWRGLCRGVIEAALDRFAARPDHLQAWLGPHICADHYPVGDDMRAACLEVDPEAETAFRAMGPGQWRADIGAMAEARLRRRGVTRIGRGPCNFAAPDLYYSHRRDGRCGRMAALIWINERPAREPRQRRTA